jgi:hypothetical protein
MKDEGGTGSAFILHPSSFRLRASLRDALLDGNAASGTARTPLTLTCPTPDPATC